MTYNAFNNADEKGNDDIHTSVSSSVSWILPNPQPLKSPLMLSRDATSPWSRPCRMELVEVNSLKNLIKTCFTISAALSSQSSTSPLPGVPRSGCCAWQGVIFQGSSCKFNWFEDSLKAYGPSENLKSKRKTHLVLDLHSPSHPWEKVR